LANRRVRRGGRWTLAYVCSPFELLLCVDGRSDEKATDIEDPRLLTVMQQACLLHAPDASIGSVSASGATSVAANPVVLRSSFATLSPNQVSNKIRPKKAPIRT
jgi:hypothetical protein